MSFLLDLGDGRECLALEIVVTDVGGGVND
jgi:hypothetical protein